MKTLLKTALTLLVILNLNAAAFAQTDSVKKTIYTHELAVDAAFLLRPVYYYGYYPSNGSTAVPPALNLLYKLNMGSTALRARVDVMVSNNSGSGTNVLDNKITTKIDTGTATSTTNQSNYIGRIGVQQSWGNENTKLYLGVDGVFLSSSTESQYKSTNRYNPGSSYKMESNYTNKSTSNGFGIAPVIGLQYSRGKHFGIGIEDFISIMNVNTTSYTAQYNKQTEVSTGNILSETQSNAVNTSKDFVIHNSPFNNLSVYLIFKF
ncbi:MAG: hypothetical protein NTX03_10715 [Bacteroidetes bacterium]|nr:hypothetical protein [Bacteroidota bacterium]